MGAMPERFPGYLRLLESGELGERADQLERMLARCTVYIRKSRSGALQPFIDLRLKGESSAGQIRDRISTRRAQGAIYRMERGW